MKNHIYLHTSNLNNTTLLRKDDDFVRPVCYTPHDITKAHPNEYGMIKTHANYYHILVGRIPSNRCPWCGEESIINGEYIKESDLFYLRFYKCYMECPSCNSRGPLHKLKLSRDISEDTIPHIHELVKGIYSDRKTEDEHFKSNTLED